MDQMNPTGKDAVLEIVKCLGDDNSDVRSRMARALDQIGPTAKEEAVPANIKCLVDDNRHVRYSEAEALGQIGPAARGAVPACSSNAWGISIVPFLPQRRERWARSAP